jgi:hypothetical protein
MKTAGELRQRAERYRRLNRQITDPPPVSPDRKALAAKFQRAELAGIPPGSIVVPNRMLATGHPGLRPSPPGMDSSLA